MGIKFHVCVDFKRQHFGQALNKVVLYNWKPIRPEAKCAAPLILLNYHIKTNMDEWFLIDLPQRPSFSALVGIGCGVILQVCHKHKAQWRYFFAPLDQTEDALVAGAQLTECFRSPEGRTKRRPGARAALTLSCGLENKHTTSCRATCLKVEQAKHEQQC